MSTVWNRYVGAFHEASQLACLFIGIDWNRTRKSYNRATHDLGMDMVDRLPGHSALNNQTLKQNKHWNLR